ncbi:hypothetical protein NDU88_005239 [Pleurodeles waltl]|uniref:Uncharacterized protein n=1 Tax=Pleurodeles waltl TaxID=8319 RepID=A0AAV7UHK4_PLEWA|nr:hypothetical protein NDU88_005239 [Pleurodeles waltl]
MADHKGRESKDYKDSKESKASHKRFKPDSTVPDSPVKSKEDMPANTEVIMQHIIALHTLAQHSRNSTDAMYCDIQTIHTDLKGLSDRHREEESRISSLEDAKTPPLISFNETNGKGNLGVGSLQP